MPITQRIYRGKKDTAILAVALCAPRRNLRKISEPVRDLSQGTIAEAEKADVTQVNAVSKI
jgi:hypothetical protein